MGFRVVSRIAPYSRTFGLYPQVAQVGTQRQHFPSVFQGTGYVGPIICAISKPSISMCLGTHFGVPTGGDVHMCRIPILLTMLWPSWIPGLALP